VIDLVQSTCVDGLLLKASDQFKGLTATTLALGCWSLGALARRLVDCHQQSQADSVWNEEHIILQSAWTSH
jgi:hypothetical protein